MQQWSRGDESSHVYVFIFVRLHVALRGREIDVCVFSSGSSVFVYFRVWKLLKRIVKVWCSLCKFVQAK